MKQFFTPSTKRWIYGISCFLLALMVLGSFFDYSFSQILYRESSTFGIFFAAFGEYPITLGFTAAGTMLLTAHNRKKKTVGILQILLGGWFILSGTVMASVMPTLYLSLPAPIVAVIGLLCSVLVVFFTFRLCRESDYKIVLRIALVIICVIFAEMLLVNLVKIPWGRARMRLVANDPRAFFMPWWQPGSELKTTLTMAGVAAEEFKSFPSGHTANASTLMLLGLLPLLRPRWESKQSLLFVIGFAWTFLVAFSRIIMGAHYLTDTIVGFTIGFGVQLITCFVVFRHSCRHTKQ